MNTMTKEDAYNCYPHRRHSHANGVFFTTIGDNHTYNYAGEDCTINYFYPIDPEYHFVDFALKIEMNKWHERGTSYFVCSGNDRMDAICETKRFDALKDAVKYAAECYKKYKA